MPVGIGLGVAGVAGAAASRSGARSAASASRDAAGIQADAQMQALNYIREINALPQELREEALRGLRDFGQNFQGHQYGTDIGGGEIQNWLRNNPSATDAQIAVAMQRNGISPIQVAAATGRPLAEVQARFQAQGGMVAPQYRDAKGQDQLISEAMNSPLYAAIMGTQRAGEQSILRNASATGGLRSGNANGALTDFGQQTANRALLDSFGVAQASDRFGLLRDDVQRNFVQGQANYDRQQAGSEYYREQGIPLSVLTGLAGLSGNENAIAGLTSDIGATTAAGMTGSAQALQQGNQNAINNLMGIAGLGIQAYGNGMINI